MTLEARVYNQALKKMFYFSPIRATIGQVSGVSARAEDSDVVFANSDPVMFKSGIKDDFGNDMWEGDIAEVGIQTPYGVVAEKSIMIFDGVTFTMKVNNAHGGQNNFPIVSLSKLGNMYEHSDIIKAK